MPFNESIVEDAALDWFEELGYAFGHGPDMALDEPATERDSSGEAMLADRLPKSIRGLNQAIAEDAQTAIKHYLQVRNGGG